MLQAQRREFLKGKTLGIAVNNVSFLLEHLADLRERKFLRFNMPVQRGEFTEINCPIAI